MWQDHFHVCVCHHVCQSDTNTDDRQVRWVRTRHDSTAWQRDDAGDMMERLCFPGNVGHLHRNIVLKVFQESSNTPLAAQEIHFQRKVGAERRKGHVVHISLHFFIVLSKISIFLSSILKSPRILMDYGIMSDGNRI